MTREMRHAMYEVTLRRLILLNVEKAQMGLAMFYGHVMGVCREGTTMLLLEVFSGKTGGS